MATHKRQHVIPACYLRAWCDPNTPKGQSPYIWRISKDGSSKRNKSPEKSFTETDRYTITLPNGERNLTVEHALADLETRFVQVLKRIRGREKLTDWDKARLCMFTAAMHARTVAMGDHWKTMWETLHRKVVAGEKRHNAEPITSLETAKMVQHARQNLVMVSLQVQTPMYFAMGMSILVTSDEIGFITSDTPCIWNNPKLHTYPPAYRHPALGQKEIEVTLPITPHHLLLISHTRYPLYVDVKPETVDSANLTARWGCGKEFISWKGETKPYWFERQGQPEDAWENTEEGKRLVAEAELMRKRQKEWERSRDAKYQRASSG